MPLYDRLLGVRAPDPEGAWKIPLHQFIGLLGEYARGRITGQAAQDAVAAMSGRALDAGEVTEAQALLALITGAGAATAKLAKAAEVEHVLVLAERGVVYATPESVKARLGV